MSPASRPRRRSAGLLMYRRREGAIEFFLVHPGGPYFARKSRRSWTVPKGEPEAGEDPLAVARREFFEETGRTPEQCGAGAMLHLGTILQPGGKEVEAWAFEGDWPAGAPLTSNTFRLEWPPRSGREREFPEVDEGRFFDEAGARAHIRPAQAPFLDRLLVLSAPGT